VLPGMKEVIRNLEGKPVSRKEKQKSSTVSTKRRGGVQKK